MCLEKRLDLKKLFRTKFIFQIFDKHLKLKTAIAFFWPEKKIIFPSILKVIFTNSSNILL